MNDIQAIGFTLVIEDFALGAAALDLIAIAPAADRYVALLDFWLHHVDGATSAGDAAAQHGRITVERGYVTPGSGGVALTPAAANQHETSAAAFTARGRDTVLASGGSPVIYASPPFPVQSGCLYRPPRVCAPRVAGGEILVVRLKEALAIQPIQCSLTAHLVQFERGGFDLVGRTLR